MYQEKSDGYSIVEGGDKDGYGYQTLNFDSTHHTDAGKIGTTVVYRDSDADLDGSATSWQKPRRRHILPDSLFLEMISLPQDTL